VALRNAVTNTVLLPEIDEDLQAMFLNYVDLLTPWHLRVLTCLHDPDAHFRSIGSQEAWFYQKPGSKTLWSKSKSAHELMAAAFPEVIGEWQFLSQVIHDLGQRSLVAIAGLYDSLPDVGPYTTMTGQKFMKYIGTEAHED